MTSRQAWIVPRDVAAFGVSRFGSASMPTIVTMSPAFRKVDSDALLLAVSPSSVSAVTEASLVISCETTSLAIVSMVTEALAAFPMAPRLQVTVPTEWMQLP